MAYFDNAATTFPKPIEVYEYMDRFYRSSGANVGRGHYGLAQNAGKLISETRKRIQALLHCPAKQVVFEPTATIALNIIIQGLIRKGVKNIYISPFEHNAVTRTLHFFEEQDEIKVHQLAVLANMQYDLERIKYQFESLIPDLVIVSHASNVCGLVAPVEEIFLLAKKYQAITLLDMAQTAGLIDCNIGLDTFDFAVFAGHKTLYGPTGISGFVMNPNIELSPVIFGGTGYDSANQNMPDSLPEKYEMGTINIAGIAGLNAALRWSEEKGLNNIFCKELENRECLLNILNQYDFIHVVGYHPAQKYIGIVSCVLDGVSSDSAGMIFNQCNIAVRTGLHCAPLAHQFLGTYPSGTVRFSPGYFTTEEEFKELQDALEYIEDNL